MDKLKTPSTRDVKLLAIGAAAMGSVWFLSKKERRDRLLAAIRNNGHVQFFTLASVACYAHVEVAVNSNGSDAVKRVRNVLFVATLVNISIIGVYWYNKTISNNNRESDSNNNNNTNTTNNVNTKNVNNNAKTAKNYITSKDTILIRNPLILLVGISKYDENECKRRVIECNELPAVKTDIENLYDVFTNKFKYKNVYKMQDFIATHYPDSDIWQGTRDMVFEFCKSHSSMISNNNNDNKIDGLLFFYSGHGMENDWLFCGKGDILSLYQIKQNFEENKCKKLEDKPKYFFMDCCRDKINYQSFTNDERNEFIRNRGCKQLMHDKDEVIHDPTNMCTTYATANFQGTEEDSRYGGYMSKVIYDQLNNNQDISFNQLKYILKQELKHTYKQTCEQKDSLLFDNLKLVPN